MEGQPPEGEDGLVTSPIKIAKNKALYRERAATMEMVRVLAIFGFIAGGLVAFWLDQSGAGYMLVGAAAAAFNPRMSWQQPEKKE